MAPPAKEDEEAQRLKSQLEALKQRIQSCKTVHDYYKLTEEANNIAKAAVAACRRKALLKEPATQPASGGAAGDGGSSIATSSLSQLPDTDDGKTCMLLRLPKGWGPPRMQAFIERFGAKPCQVSKNPGETHALIVFSQPEHRTLFWEEFKKAEQEGTSTGSAGQFLVKFPGAVPGARSQQQGVKRPGAGAGAGAEDDRPPRPAKQPKTDIRQVVCPWWDRPYQDQLADKMAAVESTLRSIAGKVAHSYGRYEKPQWLSSALHMRGKEALPLPGIVRSPQLNGYRNKAEFTVGLDGSDQPTVGFLLGNFVDGVTTVSEPGDCRHMSPTSLAYAAAMNTFLRSSSSKLPTWDKRHNKGFWRLLTVREGHASSFLPLPVAAAAADGSSSSSSEQQQPQVLSPTPLLADVPCEKWLVKNPGLSEALLEAPQAGIELTEVTEIEPIAPPPAEVIVMVQVNPTAASGPEEIREQLLLLGAALRGAAALQGLPLTKLLVQYHSGVANAAPLNAPVTLFPGEEGSAGDTAGAGGTSGGAEVGAEVGSFSDVLCEVKFRVPPNAFFQVNNGATCLLYHTVGRMAAVGPQTLLLDVCCGTGTIGITLAKQVAAVVGVDNVESAIDDARLNASLNGITNATFVCGAAEKVMDDVLAEHAPKHSHIVAVVDPPRAGLHRNVLRALLSCAALKRLVFVSCNPDTLVLNAGLLCSKHTPGGGGGGGGGRDRQGGGGGGRNWGQSDALPPMAPYIPFRPTQVLAFDLFPHTKHVEVVMLLERD